MQETFIPTENINRFNDICSELIDPSGMVGPSLAMITGPAGRGKSEAAKKYAANTNAIYIPPMERRSPSMLLREITFELCMVKPGRIESCLNVIGDEMARDRRIVIIDEADLVPMPQLEMLRNINERYACPIVLVGEDGLKGKIASRRRLSSRVRRKMEFGPVSQPDIAMFLHKSMNLNVGPKEVSLIHKAARGDWRPVLTLAVAIERSMTASGMTEMSVNLVQDLIKSGVIDGNA